MEPQQWKRIGILVVGGRHCKESVHEQPARIKDWVDQAFLDANVAGQEMCKEEFGESRFAWNIAINAFLAMQKRVESFGTGGEGLDRNTPSSEGVPVFKSGSPSDWKYSQPCVENPRKPEYDVNRRLTASWQHSIEYPMQYSDSSLVSPASLHTGPWTVHNQAKIRPLDF